MNKMTNWAMAHSRLLFSLIGFTVFLVIGLVAIPSLFPTSSSYLHAVKIDTDPENMLSSNEPVRIFHNEMKQKFGLYDMLVVGITNPSNPQGVFTVDVLNNIYDLTQSIQNMQWEEDGKTLGVVGVDVLAPSTVDNIEQEGVGTVRFEWLMDHAPSSEKEAQVIAHKASRIPFLKDTLISGDQKALAIYVPITSKNVSYEVAQKIQEKISTFQGKENYHITGLPVAQDQFGVEMFKQMALSAPLAMLLIFLLMWFFFKNVGLIIAPMIVAMISVILTMGALVISGQTIHIMSSMIPIFIMPIAVLDAVHILSDFFDRYPKTKQCHLTVKEVMRDLNSPMLFTSLTTAAGFLSLAFTPIPPVQVFGIFVASGVLIAWLLTVTMVPAYISLLPQKSLDAFGKKHCEIEEEKSTEHKSWMDKVLTWTGKFSYQKAKGIIIGTFILIGISALGISKIQINDNPVKWFEKSHPIRVSDQVLNDAFAGTYMAYLTLSPKENIQVQFSTSELESFDPKILSQLQNHLSKTLDQKLDLGDMKKLEDYIFERQDSEVDDETWEKWDEAAQSVSKKIQEFQIFKRPDVLHFIERLQEYVLQSGVVGKSNALPDVVKTVHRELFLGKDEAYKIPDTAPAVSQVLVTYQGGHRPQDLWHFVTPSFDQTNLWIQLNSGDNRDMQSLIDAVDEFMKSEQAPLSLSHKWFGLTYINVIWQQKMVKGMMESFGGSFFIVLFMMIFLFRSLWWGLLSMVPLTVSIAFIYGFIGFIGKDYDMPVAVLSSLSLGLAVDYAIHFLARSREIKSKHETWKEALEEVFQEPGRAIVRNVIVIGVGFTPLLFAPLVPYQTVGFFISAILLLAGVASLVILPAMITLGQNYLFRSKLERNKS